MRISKIKSVLPDEEAVEVHGIGGVQKNKALNLRGLRSKPLPKNDALAVSLGGGVVQDVVIPLHTPGGDALRDGDLQLTNDKADIRLPYEDGSVEINGTSIAANANSGPIDIKGTGVSLDGAGSLVEIKNEQTGLKNILLAILKTISDLEKAYKIGVPAKINGNDQFVNLIAPPNIPAEFEKAKLEIAKLLK